MKIWKIIFAAVVIFAAGFVTGGLATSKVEPPRKESRGGTGPFGMNKERRAEYIKKLHKNLQLTTEQSAQVETILVESQNRMKKLWEPMAPEAKAEYGRTRKEITQILTPEQRKKFEELRHGPKGDDRKKDNSQPRARSLPENSRTNI